MENENKETQVVEKDKKAFSSIAPWIVTILIAAWLIGMAILAAGWLVAKEIAKQSVNQYAGQNESLPALGPIENLQIPDNKARQGSDDAKVTVVEFADFQCPFCGEWHKDIYPKLKSEYIDTGKVRFVFWDLAFLGEESSFAAEAAMCAKDQGKFWEYHDKLFESQGGENQNAFANNNLKLFAKQIGLNETDFNSCVDSRINKPMVEESASQAGALGIASTPTVLINGIPIEGSLPWENYKKIIESELAK